MRNAKPKKRTPKGPRYSRKLLTDLLGDLKARIAVQAGQAEALHAITKPHGEMNVRLWEFCTALNMALATHESGMRDLRRYVELIAEERA